MGTRDDLQLRVLAVASRRRLFELIEQAPAALPVTELAARLELHQNTVRLHLDVLIDAGLVEATEPAPSARGRRPVRYRATGRRPAADGEAVRQLVSWLAAALPSPAEARVAGRRIGAAAAAATPGKDPSSALFDLLAAEGFAPESTADGRAIELRHCPFSDVTTGAPGVICALHLGIVEAFDGGTPADAPELVVTDPRAASCSVRLRRPMVRSGRPPG